MSASLWYKDAIIYQAHVKAFADSNGDGIGDFGGLMSKLDYFQSLGVTAIWLLPFYPSPLRDDGYDIADYYNVNPQYGTLADFQRVSEGSPRARAARHHRTGHQPHQRPEPVVPAGAPGEERLGRARFLRLERHDGEIPGRPHHLQGFRAVELDVGPGGGRNITGTAFSITSRT